MEKKKIALVAHDKEKQRLVEWVEFNRETLAQFELYCTGTTGRLIQDTLSRYNLDSVVIRMKSGPLGGDQQLGSLICTGKIDYVFFLVDNLSMQPHDVDIKALSRLTQLYNIPAAYNIATADHIISSPLFMNDRYERIEPDFITYINREL